MKRTYLEEDMELIRRYFPGAKTVALRTPFDLSVGPVDRAQLLRDDTEQEAFRPDWQGDLLWSR